MFWFNYYNLVWSIIKSNFLKMKLSWVHSISHPVEPSRLESPEPSELARRLGITRWSKLDWMSPSGFIKSVFDVCPCWVPRCLFPTLSTVVNLRTIWRRQLLSSSPLAGSQTWWQTWWPDPPWSKVDIRGSNLTLFKGVGPRMGSPES